MNKVIAAMMMMAITSATPAMADKKYSMDKSVRGKVEVVNHNSKNAPHVYTHKKNDYRPDVRTCTIKLCRHDSHRKLVAKAERINGVMDTKWNSRTRELTIRFDAHLTSAHYIKHLLA